MTEEDTFNALRKLPYKTLESIVINWNGNVGTWIEQNAIISQYGWEPEVFWTLFFNNGNGPGPGAE